MYTIDSAEGIQSLSTFPGYYVISHRIDTSHTHLMPTLIDDGGAYKLETYVDLMLSMKGGEDILFHFSQDATYPRNIYTYTFTLRSALLFRRCWWMRCV